MSEYLDVAVKAAQEVGALLKEKLGRVLTREKGPADLVTETDVMAQRKIEETLLNAFPDHCFLGEESQGATPSFGEELESVVPSDQMLHESQCGSGAPEDKPYTWIIDPLDGTTNFVHGVPFFCTSIALARGNDVLCGVIYNPINCELFTAEKGQGAFLNGERITTSGETEPAQSLVAFGAFSSRTSFNTHDYAVFQRSASVCQSIRRSGSTALNLAYVACGRFDAMSCCCAHPWDVAAGVCIALEAGGVATHFDGSSFDIARQPLLASACVTLQYNILKMFND
ncbi:MAG: inositol monophosphatase family protein [Thermoguttaceae bacterium]|jgi:myo-inositol-1(or 4)-monophosphatase